MVFAADTVGVGLDVHVDVWDVVVVVLVVVCCDGGYLARHRAHCPNPV